MTAAHGIKQAANERQILMQQFSEEKLNRPEARKLMEKAHPQHDKEIDRNGDKLFSTHVHVHFKDGSELQHSVSAPKGIDPPASNEDIVQKWRLLVKDVLEDTRRDQIEARVLKLEKLEDVRELIALLAGNVKCPIDV